MEENYSNVSLNLNYAASDNIVQNGAMDNSVFKLSKIFLDSLFPNGLLPPDIIDQLINDPDHFGEIIFDQDMISDEWIEWGKGLSNFFAAFIVGAIFTVVMWIIGLIWACSRCCCGCGKGKKSKAGDAFTAAIEVMILTTLVIFGVLTMAWFFSANNFTRSGIENLDSNVKVIVNDSDLFIDNTVKELKYVANDNFQEFKSYIDDDIDEAKGMFDETVNEVIQDIQFEELKNMAFFFADIAIEFEDEDDGKKKEFEKVVDTLIKNVTAMKNTFDEMTDLITAFCNTNTIPQCSDITSVLNDIDASFNIGPLDDVQNVLESIEIPSEVMHAVKELKSILADAESLINDFSNDFVDKKIEDIKDELDKIGKEVDDNINEITEAVDDFSISNLYTDNEKFILDMQDLYQFVFYGFLGFGFFLVFILTFYVVGVLLGSFGSVGGPAKKTGGCCLCTGSAIFFLFSSLLWLLVTIFFLIGSFSDHLICKTLDNPGNNELTSWLEKFLNQQLNESFSDASFNLDIGDIFDKCEKNEGLYEVFSLDQIFNVTEEFGDWQTKFGVTEALDDIKENVDKYIEDITGKFNVEDYDSQITEMVGIFDNLKDNFLGDIDDLDLNSIFDKSLLDGLKDQIDMIPGEEGKAIKEKFEQINVEFDTVTDDVEVIKNALEEYINNGLQYNKTEDISATLANAIELSKAALESLETGKSREIINKTVDDVFELVIGTTQGFVDHVEVYIESQFAQCRPLMNIYDLAKNTICYQILAPFNGLWTGLGLYLILMIPILILSCMLEPLFRRYKKPAYVKERHVEMTEMANPAAIVMVQGETKTTSYSIPDAYRGAQNQKK